MSQSGPASSSGGGGSGVTTLTGNSGGAVSPTAGNINVIGSGSISVAGNPGTSTLTISASGGSSALTLIATKTAANVASLTFTSGFTYNNYLLVGINVNDPTTMGAPNLIMQLSTNGGSTYIATGYLTDGSGSGQPGLILGNLGSNTGFVNFNSDIDNFNSGAGYITSNTLGALYDTTGSFFSGVSTQGVYTTASTTANAFRLLTDDATNFSGVFSLYGYTT